MLEDVRSAVRCAVRELGGTVEGVDVGLPGDSANGDVMTNAALLVAKTLSCPPRDFATLLAMKLETDERFASVWVAGPGFVNLQLSDKFLREIVSSIVGSGSAYGSDTMAGTFAACFVQSEEGVRPRWAAEIATAIATHLGKTAHVFSERPEASSARELLLAHFEGSNRFGQVTSAELACLEAQLSVVMGAFGEAELVQFFAKQGGTFRPGLFENVLAENDLSCAALEACRVQHSADHAVMQLMKLYCFAHRADRELELSCETVQSPSAVNPAFRILYAAMSCKRLLKCESRSTELSKPEVSLISKLATFPEVLRLSHERAEPHRIGLFLSSCADLLASCQQPHLGRDPKTIATCVVAAADVVFSAGLAIIGVQPLDDFS